MKTVNVIEYKDDAVFTVHSFSDDEEGNKQAEGMFADFMKEMGATEEDIKVAMEEGWWEEGDYQIFLAHSS